MTPIQAPNRVSGSPEARRPFHANGSVRARKATYARVQQDARRCARGAAAALAVSLSVCYGVGHTVLDPLSPTTTSVPRRLSLTSLRASLAVATLVS